MHTIYALSTILGRSGVAVIRISGSRAKEILLKFTQKKDFEPRRATFCTLFSPSTGEVLDQIIAIFFKGPQTFTGSDLVEFHLHGSIAVIKDVLNELGDLDFTRCAEPGEFTKMAFENGKMDLIGVEALGDLIHSETTAQRRAAIYQISGHLSNLYASWKDSMINIMAQFEAYIDFPEDDIPTTAIKTAMDIIIKLIQEIEDHLIISEKASTIMNGIHIAIGGPPNAGKSSIMNLIAKQDIAIVSDIAGTTRDVLQVQIEISGLKVTIYDTAGIREHTSDLIEAEGIKRAKNALDNADIVIYVFDASTTTKDEIDTFNVNASNAIILMNKFDLINSNTSYNSTILEKKDYIPFSVKNSYNLNLLLDKIAKLIEEKFSVDSNAVVTTQQRQKEKLIECMRHLESIDLFQPLEITAQKIRSAVSEVEYITGKITLDDVLDKIFSTFCIGK
jgi:tRNA modification GTPase